MFRGGEGALQVLPPLIDVIPEARLNLVIYYLRQGELKLFSLSLSLSPCFPALGFSHLILYQDLLSSASHKLISVPFNICFVDTTDDVQEAYNLIKDLEPTTPQVVNKLLSLPFSHG